MADSILFKKLLFVLILFSVPILICERAFADDDCLAMFDPPPFSSIRMKMRLGENWSVSWACYRTLEALQRRDQFDIKKAQVLFMSYFEGTLAHAVIEYDGWIIDPALANISGEASQRRFQSYFGSMKVVAKSKVRTVPAGDFKWNYLRRSNFFYWYELNKVYKPILDVQKMEAELVNQRYPMGSLRDFLKNRGVTPRP